MNASLNNFERLSDGKDNNAWAQPPEPLTQAVGDSFNVVVTHLQSPSEMVLQKVENANVIQELQQKLREHCSRGPGPQNFRPAPGTVCCAQFSDDKQWYRAKVLGYPSEERVCVGYLDFGNSEEVALSHLQPITPALLTLPMQAIRCGLAGVQPVGETWSDDCVLALQRRVSNRILRIKIQGAHEGKTLVAMTDDNSDPQANIGELLNSAGFSAPTVPSSVQQPEQAAAAAEPQVPNRPPEPLLWTYTELPTDGQTVALWSSILRSPQDFYCRLKNPTDHKRLLELGNELKQHCTADTSSTFEPKAGEPCCALCPADGLWYRAMVNEVYADAAAVVFVDYGNSLRLKRNQLKSITAPLLALPFQAIHCRLAGVEPLGSEWSSGALLWFQMLLDEQWLSVRVLAVEDRVHSVKLEAKGEDVAALLISKQLAKASKEAAGSSAREVRREEEVLKKEQSPRNAQGSGQSGARPREPPATDVNASSAEAHLFPLDWKTGQLNVNETFPPYIAAAVSPTLFFLFNHKRMEQAKVNLLMEELAVHCANNPTSTPPTVLSRVRPGAACCAQFSADNKWYRAVVLEVGEGELSVIYADYGNMEKVPFSRVRPIPPHLLQLPFQIIRCTLSGKEQFPAEWPGPVLQAFQRLLLKSIQATVECYDGSANVLSLVTLTESGRCCLTDVVLDTLLQAQRSSPPTPTPTAQKAAEHTDRTSAARVLPRSTAGIKETVTTVSPASPQRLSQPPQLSGLTPSPAAGDPLQKLIEQMKTPPETQTTTSESQTSSCCCQSLRAKVDHLEQLMQQQISLLKHATKNSNI